MSQKVNPIDFENGEGNLGMANALLEFFCRKLPITRLQRDLSDSTVQRNIGMSLAYALLGYENARAGLTKITPKEKKLKEVLDEHWEVLAEPVQVILRREGMPDAYEQLKELTRGKIMTAEDIRAFVDNLSVPDATKKELLALTPQTYIGMAVKLTEQAVAEGRKLLKQKN